jgi:ABC-2 type transport system ATP-binding protein
MTHQGFVVDANRLTKRYGAGIVAVDQLTLRVRHGEIYGFIGPNGAGKTTTLRMLLGLIRPTSGSISVLGAQPGTPASLTGLGALIETPTFYPYLSGRDNLRVIARYASVGDEHVETALAQVKLVDRAGDSFQTYSLGMKQRLGVAAALIKDPEFLILDEPMNGLDPPGMADMRALIQELGRSGRTVLFSSHQLSDVSLLCDRVGIISRGRLVAEGSVAELSRESGILVRADPPDVTWTVLATAVGVDRVATIAEGVLVDAPASAAPRLMHALVAAGISVHEVRPLRQSLDEIFDSLTGAEARQGQSRGEAAAHA